MKQPTNIQSVDFSWDWLYKIGGAAALISALFIPIQVLVFIIWPPPLQGNAGDWFALLQENRLVGLVDLDLLLVADNVLLVPLFLALYILLHRANQSLMFIATALGFLGIALFIASNPAFEMLSLSNLYAVATSGEQRLILLAAGQAMLATWQGSAFQIAYLLGSLAGIAMGIVMLQSGLFGRVAAYMGIFSNAVGLGLYVPVVGVYISVFSVLFLEIWYILVAWRLLQLGRGVHSQSGASALRWRAA